uniref:Uncharacterized protein n=1 Tax=Acrobeloides nanus TaxID=290746 RepID=A0A914BVN1_9BILA
MAIANKQLLIAYLSLFTLIIQAQGNIEETAVDLGGALNVQKRGADDVVAIKTNHFLPRVKRCDVYTAGCNACIC